MESKPSDLAYIDIMESKPSDLAYVDIMESKPSDLAYVVLSISRATAKSSGFFAKALKVVNLLSGNSAKGLATSLYFSRNTINQFNSSAVEGFFFRLSRN